MAQELTIRLLFLDNEITNFWDAPAAKLALTEEEYLVYALLTTKNDVEMHLETNLEIISSLKRNYAIQNISSDMQISITRVLYIECLNCGSSIPENSRFCNQCAHPFESTGPTIRL